MQISNSVSGRILQSATLLNLRLLGTFAKLLDHSFHSTRVNASKFYKRFFNSVFCSTFVFLTSFYEMSHYYNTNVIVHYLYTRDSFQVKVRKFRKPKLWNKHYFLDICRSTHWRLLDKPILYQWSLYFNFLVFWSSDHLLSMDPKFPQKLSFITSWYAHVRVRVRG